VNRPNQESRREIAAGPEGLLQEEGPAVPGMVDGLEGGAHLEPTLRRPGGDPRNRSCPGKRSAHGARSLGAGEAQGGRTLSKGIITRCATARRSTNLRAPQPRQQRHLASGRPLHDSSPRLNTARAEPGCKLPLNQDSWVLGGGLLSGSGRSSTVQVCACSPTKGVSDEAGFGDHPGGEVEQARALPAPPKMRAKPAVAPGRQITV